MPVTSETNDVDGFAGTEAYAIDDMDGRSPTVAFMKRHHRPDLGEPFPWDVQLTTPDEEIASAPRIVIQRELQRDARLQALSGERIRRADEARWRRT